MRARSAGALTASALGAITYPLLHGSKRAKSRVVAASFALIVLTVACNGSDDSAAARKAVLRCVIDGGGQIEDSTDVAFAGDQAVAIKGPVDASVDLIDRCLASVNG